MHVRIGPQSEEVLLAMTIKPFLSHKRENARVVGRLRDSLKIYGAGGWKDTEDLRLGDRTKQGIRRAIFQETGGMMWWGTRQSLVSRFMNEVEIPCALQRKGAEPLYPLVPVFVDLDPGNELDRRSIRGALGEYGADLLDCNGLVRRQAESAGEFRRRAAVRYVRDAVKALASKPAGEDHVTVALRALSEPSGEHDLTFDWRALIDPKERFLHPGGYDLILDALEAARDSLQAAFRSPSVLVDIDLPLTLAGSRQHIVETKTATTS
ncbi:MAG: TIR domain-containing protein [Actinomycetota bacterium]